MGMKLYDWKNSYNSKKIRAVAFESDIALALVPVDMAAGDHKKPDYVAKNPNGKVPLLESGSFYLWESNAICFYLASLDPSRRLLPTDPQQRAPIDQWVLWQTAHLTPSIGKISYERLWKKRFNLGEPDEAAVAAAMPEVDRFLSVLDANLAKHQWVAGDLSVADFVLTAAFSARADIGLDLSKYAHINAWLNRVESRPSWKHGSNWE